MKNAALILAFLAALVMGGLTPEPVFARGEQDRALELRKERDLIPYREIQRRAERRFNGRVVGQRLFEQGGRMVYELRILQPDGKVIVALYDAKTGRVIGTRGR